MKHSMPENDLVARTLWQVETTLTEAPSLAALAEALGVSRFHLTRAFSLRTGLGLMAYVRARRLSEAAKALSRPGTSVIAAGCDAGYDSAAGFSRAFRSYFGCAPSEIRTAADLPPLPLQEPLTMTLPHLSQPPVMTDFAGLTLTGRSARFTLETRARIPGFWADTVQHHGAEMMGHETFGVCYDFDDAGGFRYLIGLEAPVLRQAEGAATLALPAGRHAVFDHSGHIATIGDTWDAIFSDWAPGQSAWTLTGRPEFERYAADFDPGTPGGVAVWIPVDPA